LTHSAINGASARIDRSTRSGIAFRPPRLVPFAQRRVSAAPAIDQTRAEEIRIKRENELLDQAIFGAKATTTFSIAAVSYLESR
jgi:hypothetical protein